RMSLPQRDHVLRGSQDIGQPDVLSSEPLVGANDPLRFLAILREGERYLIAGELHVEGAAESRRGDEVYLVAHRHAGLLRQTGTGLVGVVIRVAAAACEKQRADQDRAKKESPSHRGRLYGPSRTTPPHTSPQIATTFAPGALADLPHQP